ncbi:unnamed protein product [Fusarium graminearum]|nr:unnamed protein product [Fusarium graminearum]CAG1977509.1 unnamed protein product [Fusarium graminearum]
MSNDEPQDHDMLDNDVESPIVDSDHVIELLNHVDPNAEVIMEDAEMGAIPQATVDDADDEGSETSRPPSPTEREGDIPTLRELARSHEED